MGESLTSKRRGWRRRLMSYFFLLVGLYVVYCGLLFFFQLKLMFPAGMAGPPSEMAAAFHKPIVIEIATEQGTTRGWYLPAPGLEDVNSRGQASGGLVVFFHGNAELIDHQSGIIELYHRMGLSVLLPEYRGYGHSEGSPSEQHIVADAVAMLERVMLRPEVDRGKVVLHGRSIGGGLAAQVADKMARGGACGGVGPAAVIVESTFVSVSGMAWRYGVPPVLVRSPLKTGEVFERSTYPVLIFHGERDEIVPVRHAHELLKLAPNGKLLVFDCDHNTLPPADQAEAYEQAIRMHLEEAGVVGAADQEPR